jgi:hypothetical protein
MIMSVWVTVKGEDKCFSFKHDGSVVRQSTGEVLGWVSKKGGEWVFNRKNNHTIKFNAKTREGSIKRWADWRNGLIKHCTACCKLFPLNEIVEVRGVTFCKEHKHTETIEVK